jgi:uncharacterized membrane protein YadS
MNTAARAAQWRGQLLEAWPGLVLAIVIAIASTFIAEQRGGPTLLYALLIGMVLNPIASEGRAKAGADFAARRVLRLGVALLGARITFEQIGGLGWSAGLLMVGAVAATLAFGMGSRPCSDSDAASASLPAAPPPSAAPRPRSRSPRCFRDEQVRARGSSSRLPASRRYRRSR